MTIPGEWTVHGERSIYDSEWMSLRLVDVETPSGNRFDHHVARIPAEAAATLALWPEGSTNTRAYEPMIGCECNCPGKDQSEIPFIPFECCAYDMVASMTAAAAAGVDIAEYCTTRWAPTATPGQCDVSGHGMDVTPECASTAEATFDGFLWSVMEPNLVCVDQDTAGCDSFR